MSYLSQTKIRYYILPHQHGFYQNRSTATNRGIYKDFSLCSVEVGHQMDIIYIDLDIVQSLFLEVSVWLGIPQG